MTGPVEPLFECRFYIGRSGQLNPKLPRLTGPRRLVTFAPVAYGQLIEPDFRQLLATFEQLPVTAS